MHLPCSYRSCLLLAPFSAHSSPFPFLFPMIKFKSFKISSLYVRRLKALKSPPHSPNKSKWVDYVFKLNNLLTHDSVKSALDSFYQNVISPLNLNPDRLISIQLKVILVENEIRSISTLQTVSLSDFSYLSSAFCEFVTFKGDTYNYDYDSIDSILFTYKLLSSDLSRSSEAAARRATPSRIATPPRHAQRAG